MLRFLVPCSFVIAPLLAAGEWTSRPAYPLPRGAAGVVAGTHRGVLIAAGGANFPDRMPWDGGKKVYHDDIFVLAAGGDTWREAGRLPAPRAYAAAVSIPNGVLVIGGENGDNVFGDTLLLQWNGKSVDVRAGPPLPAARTSSAAAVVDRRVFVAGGWGLGAVRVSQRDFWCLDSSLPADGWKILPSWPGPARAQAVAASVDDSFYLLSGLDTRAEGTGGSLSTYLTDAYRYRGDRWERLPEMPWSAVAAPSPAPCVRDPARLMVIGGVDGQLVGRVPRDTRVPDRMLVYDVRAARWERAAERWPEPVVTAPCVAMGNEWWIISGEIMAGVRTTAVNSWRWALP